MNPVTVGSSANVTLTGTPQLDHPSLPPVPAFQRGDDAISGE
jgi:hypothetical protein